MTARAQYAIFETGEVFDSREVMAKDLGMSESMLKDYLYRPTSWFGLHLYSIPDIDKRCIKCKIDLNDDNWIKHHQKQNHRICKKCYSKQAVEKNHKLRKKDWIGYKLRNLKRSYGGNVTKEELKNLFESQNKKCVLCSDKLELDAHLDHIVPISKGGETVISNLQFLCKMCNIGKNNNTDKEYIAHCKKVAKENL